jgi:hypothetical protein
MAFFRNGIIEGRKHDLEENMKKLLITAIAVVTLVGGAFTSTKEPVKAADSQVVVFSDIKGHWAEEDIDTAIRNGYVHGYPDGTFRPNGTITRAEYAALLSRVTNLKPASTSDAFPDLKNHWSREEVNKLVALGFIVPSDYPNGFGPEKELTRYEMMKWISTGLAKSDPSFKQALADTKNTLLPTPESFKGGISAEQIPYIALVKGTGIIEGFEDGTFRPSNTTTRAEVTAILLRYAKVEGTWADQYRALNELREVGKTGTNLTTISNYKYVVGNFSDISNTNITLKNNSGVLKLHRFIVVDATSGEQEGVYAPLFVRKLHDKQKGTYVTFTEMSFVSNLEKSNLLTFSMGLSTGLFSFDRIADKEHVDAVGIETLPFDSQTYIKKGVEKRFWTTYFLNGSHGAYYLKTDNGKVMQIEN